MFKINADGSIYVTRGDTCTITVAAMVNGEKHKFKGGDVLRIKVYERKACNCVVLQKDFPILAETDTVDLVLTERDTRIGELINKPVDYWYEIELNPLTSPQTIIGYDDEGAKAFRLFPEGEDVDIIDPIEPEDIPIVDRELDLLSTRPVENHAITRGILEAKEACQKENQETAELLEEHKEDKGNPHGVTKEQIGLGNADNTSDMDKPISTAQAEAINGIRDQMTEHSQSQSNPHGVTAAQLGLGNVDNTADVDKPISTAQREAIVKAQETADEALTLAKSKSDWSFRAYVLESSKWEGTEQRISCAGAASMEVDQPIFVNPSPYDRAKYNECDIYLAGHDTNALYFNCNKVPDSNITVEVFLFTVPETTQGEAV